MSFSRKALLAAVITLGTLAVAQDVQACHGSRRGGYSRGYSRGYSSYHRSYRPSYSSYGRPVSAPPVQPQPVPPQPAPQQQFAQQPQQFPQQQPQQFPQQQFNQQQQFPQQQPTAPQQQQIAQQPTAPQQQPAPQQTPAPAPTNNAQQSALQALGGFAPPQAPAQNQTPAHVGNWSATLGNGASVRLTLQADGNFSWVATNKAGSASSFSGRYTVGNGSLTLIRSTDNQQLAGNMTTSNNNAFSFKVAGNNNAAINFSRS